MPQSACAGGDLEEKHVLAVGEVWPAMLTTFHEDLSIDFRALESLVRFYLEAGASGLLAACWSSESECMKFSELLSTVAATVNHVGGRVPVAATPHAGDNEGQEITWRVNHLFEMGVDTVVLIANRFARQDESEEVLVDRVLQLVESVPGGRFGIYESPTPYHRLLSPSGLRELAQTKRFVFHKDTACDLNAICEKLSAISDTPLAFYNANSPTLLDSIIEGGAGYCGIGANFFPDVYVELCKCARSDVRRAWHLQHFLNIVEKWAGNPGYPRNAKVFLQMLGYPVAPHCRIDRQVSDEQQMMLNRLLVAYRTLKGHGFDSPQPIGIFA